MAQLSIDVKARTAQFQDSMDKVKRQSSGVVRDLDRGFAGLRTTFAALGGVAIFGGLVSSLSKVSSELDGLAKSAQGAGVTVEQLSALRYAADFAGVGTEKLDKGLANLGRRLEEAKDGTGEAVKAFEKLDIDPEQFDNSADLIKTLADRFEQLPDGARKSAIAMQLFGRAGADLVPLLNSGSEGLEKMRVEAERMGLIIDTETAQAAERLNDNLNRIGKAAGALQVYLAGPLINTLADLSDGFRNAQAAGKGFFDSLGALFSANDLQRAASEGIAVQETIAGIQKALSETDSPQRQRRLLGDLEAEQARLAEIDQQVQRLKGVVNETFVPRQRPKAFTPALSGEGASAGGSGGRSSLSEGQKLLRQMQDRLTAGLDLNEVQRVGIKLAQQGAAISTSEAKRAIELAQQADAHRQINDELQSRKDLNELIAQAESRAAEQLAADAERYKNLANPFRETAREIQRIQETADAGLISDETANKAVAALSKVDDATKNLQGSLRQSKSLSQEFWLSFESSAEDAIFQGEKLSDVLKSLFEDFARLAFRSALGQIGNSLLASAGGGAQAAAGGAGGGASSGGGVTIQDGLRPKTIAAPNGGITVKNYNTVNGSGGVTRGDLAIAARQTEKATIASIQDAQKRGVSTV